MGDKQSFSYFGPRQARLLSTLLTHAHLPGLTSLDQARTISDSSDLKLKLSQTSLLSTKLLQYIISAFVTL
jgi:hypothetical protein